jgi:Transposase DDE domain
MPKDLTIELTSLAHFFLEPANATHRQYEALRAYFVDRLPSQQVAQRFGYTPGSFRVLCHQFRHSTDRQFFLAHHRGPQQAPRKDRRRQRVITLRKQNLSIYDIQQILQREDDDTLSTATIAQILHEEGFARLPRRRDEERPQTLRPTAAEVADARQLDLAPRQFHTRYGGLFLFLPYLAQIPLETLLEQAGWPGSKMIPAACAVRSLLALKLIDGKRHSHVMSHVFDQGLALFAGLNVIPKRAFLTEYSSRVNPAAYPELMSRWFDAVNRLGLERGRSFDLDFHTIPFHGEDAVLQKHYVSKRSRRQKGILAFLARDAEEDLLCYANAEIRKENQADEILRFVEFWRARTGHLPQELVFDSKLTTYANLDKLNNMGISFITLRRRSRKMLDEIRQRSPSAWRRVELKNITRAYRNPRILDQKIELKDYEGPIRQLTIADLGHEDPTFLLTNQMRPQPATLIQRYAYRMIIENDIADAIDFFHMDALSSAVPMKVNVDLQITLMAHSLYRLFGNYIGNGYAEAKARHIYRDLIGAVAKVSLTDDEIEVRFQKRAHNPLLLAAGLDEKHPKISWLGGRRLRLIFG